MLNERAWQFYKAVQCKVTEQLKTESRMNIDDLTLKQNMCIYILVLFGVRCFKALNVQFDSKVSFNNYIEE